MSVASVISKPENSPDAAASRRRRMLAALDIDLWRLRAPAGPGAHDAAQQEKGTEQVADKGADLAAGRPAADASAFPSAENLPLTNSSRPTGRSLTTGHRGPAAAMALLADAQSAGAGTGTSRPTTPQSPSSTETSAAPVGSHAESAAGGRPSSGASEPAIDLWCLSGPQGVLLAKSGGLSPHAQRLLNDVFQAASRVVVGKYEQRQGTAVQPALLLGSGADKMPGKITTQQLRFSWPPAEPGVALGVDASTSRALRGFLGRHLQGKSNAFLLYTSSELGALLDGLELAVETDRVLFIGEPEELLGNGAAKRALWQTLNAL